MEFSGVVAGSLNVVPNHCLNASALNIRAGKRAPIEQHFLEVSGQSIPIPDTEVEGLVPAKKKPMGAQRRDRVVHACEPLRHPHVIGVFRFEEKFEARTRDHLGNSALSSAESPVSRE